MATIERPNSIYHCVGIASPTASQNGRWEQERKKRTRNRKRKIRRRKNKKISG
ncbi:MAG: hypothetical protein WAN11_24275 [Syntrophobacteraceae bacterium]